MDTCPSYRSFSLSLLFFLPPSSNFRLQSKRPRRASEKLITGSWAASCTNRAKAAQLSNLKGVQREARFKRQVCGYSPSSIDQSTSLGKVRESSSCYRLLNRAHSLSSHNAKTCGDTWTLARLRAIRDAILIGAICITAFST